VNDRHAQFWTDQTSVLFTSFWGWSPETWGTVGWTGDRGRTRRGNLLARLTDPFITVVYVTGNKSYIERDLRGKTAGFYLVSHETGDRDEFTHPHHHTLSPEKWRHSLRAIRAFSYVPEHRLAVRDFDPDLLTHALHVSAMGVVIDDRRQIRRLRETPWIEVDVYRAGSATPEPVDNEPGAGLVRAGPSNRGGYVVSEAAKGLEWKLYVLRLEGDTTAYLGRPCKSCAIYKVGLSVSPDLRRQSFQKAMPHGAFSWCVDRPAPGASAVGYDEFEAAVAGEDAMKRHLAKSSEWLGGESVQAREMSYGNSGDPVRLREIRARWPLRGRGRAGHAPHAGAGLATPRRALLAYQKPAGIW
jgi:hypothetical protein